MSRRSGFAAEADNHSDISPLQNQRLAAAAKQACFDCHSNETEWPAYSHVAPLSWLVQSDVIEGRAVLNFSEWQRAQKEAKDAAQEVLQREMPPTPYRIVHAHARLSVAETERLANGLAKTIGASAAEEEHDREP